MGLLQAALSCHAEDGIALADGRTQLTYGELREAVNEARRSLAAMPVRRVALLASNSAGWVIADLALHLERLPSVPLPVFFTDAQLRHAIDDAGIETLLTDDPQRAARLLPRWVDAGTLRPSGLAVRLRTGCDSERHAAAGRDRQGDLHLRQHRHAEGRVPRRLAARCSYALACGCDAGARTCGATSASCRCRRCSRTSPACTRRSPPARPASYPRSGRVDSATRRETAARSNCDGASGQPHSGSGAPADAGDRS